MNNFKKFYKKLQYDSTFQMSCQRKETNYYFLRLKREDQGLLPWGVGVVEPSSLQLPQSRPYTRSAARCAYKILRVLCMWWHDWCANCKCKLAVESDWQTHRSDCLCFMVFNVSKIVWPDFSSFGVWPNACLSSLLQKKREYRGNLKDHFGTSVERWRVTLAIRFFLFFIRCGTLTSTFNS